MVIVDDIIDAIETDPWAWLWFYGVQVELFKLLPSLWDHAKAPDRERLIDLVLEGPPREKYRDDLEEEEWKHIRDRQIWERLVRLDQAQAPLLEKATQALQALQDRHDQWELTGDEKEDFSIWSESSTGYPSKYTVGDFVELIDEGQYTEVVRLLSEDVPYRENDSREGRLNNWSNAVRRHPAESLKLLQIATNLDQLDADILAATMQGIAELKNPTREIIEGLIEATQSLPATEWGSAIYPYTRAIENYAEEAGSSMRDSLIQLWDVALPIAIQESSSVSSEDLLTSAINHPSGDLTEALLKILIHDHKEGERVFLEDIKERFEHLLSIEPETSGEGTRSAVIAILSSRISRLRWLDAEWTDEHILPLFDWSDPEGAASAWQGYLWGLYITPSLWEKLKDQYVETFRHLDALGRQKSRLLELLAAIVVEDFPINYEDARFCLRQVDDPGRRAFVRQIERYLEGAGDRASALWSNILDPFFEYAWPQELEYKSTDLTEYLLSVTLNTGDAFPQAVARLSPLFEPFRDPDYPLQKVREKGVAERFPHKALDLIDALVHPEATIFDDTLGRLLDTITRSEVSLRENNRVRKLSAIAEA